MLGCIGFQIPSIQVVNSTLGLVVVRVILEFDIYLFVDYGLILWLRVIRFDEPCISVFETKVFHQVIAFSIGLLAYCLRSKYTNNYRSID